MDGDGRLTEAQRAVALGYPFPRPAGDFLYDCATGDAEPLADWAAWAAAEEAAAGAAAAPRTAVLAIGSNASPQQLKRKFPPEAFAGEKIPVVACTAHGVDSVFCPYITAYGSVPATVERSPGTAVRTHVTFLTDRQLQRMHLTEGGYSYVTLHDMDIRLTGGQVLADVNAYLALRGALLLDGSHAAVGEMPSEGRAFPALSQEEVSRKVHRLVAPGVGYDAFLETAVCDAEARQGFNAALAQHGRRYSGRTTQLAADLA